MAIELGFRGHCIGKVLVLAARMTEGVRIRDIQGDKARRRAAREMIAEYHQEQLRLLLERVREGFRKLDAGEIDPFELDELIHRYKRSA